ncbi:Translation initiation factor 3 subunit J component [Diatrype stigma]|uniref:Eukaryotic translation initiation factor 3 subunit J n=1 Tax=Diatrype stigma TaxID=117547 RepID=A0AAN9UU51_9PEZI
MPSQKQWDDEESDASSAPSTSAPVAAGIARRKFDDEEGDDDDVLDSWDAGDDSEVEREKAKKAAEAKAKADAEAAANKKSKAQRIAEHKAERARRLADSDDESEDEDEAERRERLRRTEKESDLKHAEDLFGDAGLSVGVSKTSTRKATTVGSAVPIDPKDPSKTVDLSVLPLFNPQTKTQFENLRNTLVPIIGGNYKKAHYALFLQEFAKQLAKDLPSDQIKKVSSTLTALGNERMKEEKAAEKTGKKTKAQKNKTSLVTSRANTTDIGTYDDAAADFGE